MSTEHYNDDGYFSFLAWLSFMTPQSEVIPRETCKAESCKKERFFPSL